jgi:hypothetical protein
VSEYQYVAFRAVDRPLTDKELKFAEQQSTRAEITRWSFQNEYQGVCVEDLARLIGVPLDGVIGMDRLRGQVVSLREDTIDLNQDAPERAGVPLTYLSGVPCVNIKINEIPCLAAIKTGVTTTYLSEQLISTEKPSRVVEDIHPLHGAFKVNTFVNYLTIDDKNFFADAGALPDEFSLLSTTPIDVIIGTDLTNRFELILDFAVNRLHLLSR